MSYQEALIAAGAEIHAYEEFGSYQGDWLAKVTYKGQTGWIRGSYGSCSGCDAYQSEFGYGDNYCGEHLYEYPKPEACNACDQAKVALEAKLVKFGETYLDGLMTQEEVEARINKNMAWDNDAPTLLEFVQDNKI